MKLNEYQEQAMTTCMESSKNVPYMILNMGGEYQELNEKLRVIDWATTAKFDALCSSCEGDASTVAKAIRKGEVNAPIVPLFTDEEKEAILMEAGDVLWQLSGLLSVLGLSLEDAGVKNLEKLSSRKERGVIDGNGDNR